MILNMDFSSLEDLFLMIYEVFSAYMSSLKLSRVLEQLLLVCL